MKNPKTENFLQSFKASLMELKPDLFLFSTNAKENDSHTIFPEKTDLVQNLFDESGPKHRENSLIFLESINDAKQDAFIRDSQ